MQKGASGEWAPPAPLCATQHPSPPPTVASPLGPVAWVAVLALDESEKAAAGYLPHGFEGADIGVTTNTTLAGGDTIVLRVELASDASTSAGNTTAASPPPAWAARRLLPGSGDLRREVLARPAFDAIFGGLLVDWTWVWARSPAALAAEAAWLRYHGLAVAVDFTSGTTLFPGMR